MKVAFSRYSSHVSTDQDVSRSEIGTVGRPRDPIKHQAVVRATRELLDEEGFGGATVAAIARRAGVGTPTIYRRWPRREDLIEDAAFGAESESLPEPTGDLTDDISAWTELFLRRLADPVTRAALPGLLAAYHREPGRYEQLVARFEADVRESFAAMVASDTGVDQDRAVDVDTIFSMLVSSTLARALTFGLDDADDFRDRTVAALVTLVRARD